MGFLTARDRSLDVARVRVAMRAGVSAGVTGLAIFHLYLLAWQIAEGEVADPGVALRWLIAVGVFSVFAALQRGGAALSGRRAMTLWVLAALLHGPGLARPDSTIASALPDLASAAVQVAAASSGLAVVLLTVLRCEQAAAPLAQLGLRRLNGEQRVMRPARLAAYPPRPPPVASFARAR